MTNYRFTFGDFDSASFAGSIYGSMVVTNIPQPRFPAKRTSTVQIRDGENIVETGFDAYNFPITVAFTNNITYTDQVMSALVSELMRRGEDWLTVSNSGFKVRARVIDAVTFEKNLKFKQAVITFRCQPYRYTAQSPATGTTSIELVNYGNVPAYPILTFTGNLSVVPVEGYFSVHRVETVYDGSIGGTVLSTKTSDIAKIYSPLTSFVIDGVTGEAYDSNIVTNLIYVGDLPDVPPNLVDDQVVTATYSVNSNITAISADYYERCL